MKRKTLFACLFFYCQMAFAQAQTDAVFLEKLMRQHADKFGQILADPSKYRVQILYTQIDRDRRNQPTFKSFSYRVNSAEYFYPASTVKFPACLLALEKLNQLKINGLDRRTMMLSDSAFDGQLKQFVDKTNLDNGGFPTIEHYIKKILLVSDNDAFNRLYEFVGQEAFNDRLGEKGYRDIRIVHRLQLPMSREQNRRSNPIIFRNKTDGAGESVKLTTVYTQPMLVSAKVYEPNAPIKVGDGFMRGDSLVREPFDFTYKNKFPLAEQQKILRGVLFPESVAPTARFDLTADDYRFLYRFMSQLPTETASPPYKTDTAMYDTYCKFLLFGGGIEKKMPKNMRVFNKVGDAYGFLIDNAYIVDFENGVEFMLSAAIYCNSDGIFNDDKYDYETVGYPFMSNLGKLIYDLELNRKRKVKPDLSKFKMDYSR